MTRQFYRLQTLPDVSNSRLHPPGDSASPLISSPFVWVVSLGFVSCLHVVCHLSRSLWQRGGHVAQLPQVLAAHGFCLTYSWLHILPCLQSIYSILSFSFYIVYFTIIISAYTQHLLHVYPSWKRDSSFLLFLKILPFFHIKSFFGGEGEVFSLTKGLRIEGVTRCTDFEALWGIFVIRDFGRY